MILVAIIVYGMKIMPKDSFNKDYLSRENTTAIKGIFVFLVFMSHFAQYFPLGATPGDPYYFIRRNSGQLVVTMFLFYSGYGIMESVKRKGPDYIKSFPKQRVLKTMFHLDVAVLLFAVLNIALGNTIKIKALLLSFIGWSSIGNSNWFMFTIMVQYLLVFIAFTLFKKKKPLAIAAVTALSVGFILVMKEYKEPYWYNTALCLPLGLIYSYAKEYIEKAVTKNNIIYFGILVILAGAYLVSHKLSKSLVFYEAWTIIFTLIVVMLSMKASVNNKALTWLGNHVFSVYILQRIPMIIFTKLNIDFHSTTICFAVCFIITVIISELFDKAMGFADSKLFKAKAPKIKA